MSDQLKNKTKEESQEWFMNNLISIIDSELLLLEKGKIALVDRDKVFNWIKENFPSPDNTARTAEGACNEYIEHLRISSASLDPTRDMNRRKGFMAGYKAASQFKSQSCVDSVNNIIPVGKYNNNGEFVLLGAKQDSKEVTESPYCDFCGKRLRMKGDGSICQLCEC